MVSLSTSALNAEQHRNSIDAQAEREGAAIDWMEENVGTPPARSLLQKMAESHGPMIRKYRNDHLRREEALDQIDRVWRGKLTDVEKRRFAPYLGPVATNLLAQGQEPSALAWLGAMSRRSRARHETVTPLDRIRRRAKRVDRQRRMLELERARISTMTIGQASRLSGFSERRLYRVAQTGELAAMMTKHRYTIPREALVAWMRARL